VNTLAGAAWVVRPVLLGRDSRGRAVSVRASASDGG